MLNRIFLSVAYYKEEINKLLLSPNNEYVKWEIIKNLEATTTTGYELSNYPRAETNRNSSNNKDNTTKERTKDVCKNS